MPPQVTGHCAYISNAKKSYSHVPHILVSDNYASLCIMDTSPTLQRVGFLASWFEHTNEAEEAPAGCEGLRGVNQLLCGKTVDPLDDSSSQATGEYILVCILLETHELAYVQGWRSARLEGGFCRLRQHRAGAARLSVRACCMAAAGRGGEGWREAEDAEAEAAAAEEEEGESEGEAEAGAHLS